MGSGGAQNIKKRKTGTDWRATERPVPEGWALLDIDDGGVPGLEPGITELLVNLLHSPAKKKKKKKKKERGKSRCSDRHASEISFFPPGTYVVMLRTGLVLSSEKILRLPLQHINCMQDLSK